jgi:outer membrane protein TolC
LTALEDTANALVEFGRAQTRCATALVAVYKALGGGWETEQPATSTAATPPTRASF